MLQAFPTNAVWKCGAEKPTVILFFHGNYARQVYKWRLASSSPSLLAIKPYVDCSGTYCGVHIKKTGCCDSIWWDSLPFRPRGDISCDKRFAMKMQWNMQWNKSLKIFFPCTINAHCILIVRSPLDQFRQISVGNYWRKVCAWRGKVLRLAYVTGVSNLFSSQVCHTPTFHPWPSPLVSNPDRYSG